MGLVEYLQQTTADFFKVGLGGITINNNGGVAEVKNGANSSLATLRAADPTGDSDVATKGWAEANLTERPKFLDRRGRTGDPSLHSGGTMGRPYSLDLRERVVALHAAGELTQQQIADQLNLGVATVGRWVRRARAEGSPAAHPSGRGPAPLIGEREWAWIEQILRERPDSTMREVSWDLEERHQFKVSRSTVQKAVQQRGWTPKKKRFGPKSGTRSESRGSARASSSGKAE